MRENVDYTDYERGFLEDEHGALASAIDDLPTEECDLAEVIK